MALVVRQVGPLLIEDSRGELQPLGTDAIKGPQGDPGISVWRTTQTFALPGPIIAATLPGMFVWADDGSTSGPPQTVHLVRCWSRIRLGTNVQFRLQRNGVDVAGYGTASSPLTATTTVSEIRPAAVELHAGDELTVVISAVNGAPEDLSITLVLEHAV